MVVYIPGNSIYFSSFFLVAPHCILFIVVQLQLSYIFQCHLPNVLVKIFAIFYLNSQKFHLLTWVHLFWFLKLQNLVLTLSLADAAPPGGWPQPTCAWETSQHFYLLFSIKQAVNMTEQSGWLIMEEKPGTLGKKAWEEKPLSSCVLRLSETQRCITAPGATQHQELRWLNNKQSHSKASIKSRSTRLKRLSSLLLSDSRHC